jgi:hypothetical protein
MLVGVRCGSHEKHTRIRYEELVFLHPVQSTCHVVCSGASEVQNVDILFFMLRWPRLGSHKKRTGTRYTALAFLHQVQSVGHVVRSSASMV